MNSSDLHRILSRDSHTAKYYVGVFPSDKIPQVETYPAAIVINTDKNSEPGSHWLALFIEDNGTLEFFDSFGLPPDTYGENIARFAMKHAQVKWNKISLQGYTSNVCGHYCIYFLLKRCQGFSIEYIICELSGKQNDFRLYQFVKKKYGVNMTFKN